MTTHRTPNGVPAEDIVWRFEGKTSRKASTLLILPHAGGSAHTYADWRHRLPDDITFLVAQYPGRGARFAEPLPKDLDELAGPVVDALPSDTGDLYVFGHSMGALVAFEVARRLTERGDSPSGLIASACWAPHLPNPTPVRAELLDDDELVDLMRGRGGTPEEILEEPELRELILPSVRADFWIDDTYRFEGHPRVLDCPVTVLGGEQDDIVPRSDILSWSECTSSRTSTSYLPGKHFYFDDHADSLTGLLDILGSTLKPRA